MTALKDTFLQIRIRENVKRELQKVAEMRGLTMSALIHSLIVKAIREEKEADPRAFREEPKKLPATTLKLPRANEKRKTG